MLLFHVQNPVKEAMKYTQANQGVGGYVGVLDMNQSMGQGLVKKISSCRKKVGEKGGGGYSNP